MRAYDHSAFRTTFPPVSEITQRQVTEQLNKIREEREKRNKDNLKKQRVRGGNKFVECKKCKMHIAREDAETRIYSNGMTVYYCSICYPTVNFRCSLGES